MTRIWLRAMGVLAASLIVGGIVYSVESRPASIVADAVTLARPDPTLTPGAVGTATAVDLCAAGWSKAHPRHVTAAEIDAVYVEYRIAKVDRPKYVIDHLKARELDGIDTIVNLWPQPKSQAKSKDAAENRLKKAMCVGTVTLADAQAAIADPTNWHR